MVTLKRASPHHHYPTLTYPVNGSNKIPFGIGGIVLDKMVLSSLSSKPRVICSVERRALALKAAYDLYPPSGGTCIAKIESDFLPTLTPSFKFFYEAEGSREPFYRARGSFSECNWDVYGRDGREVASVSRGFLEVTERRDVYGIRAAKGADVAAVIAMAVVIDELHDEKKSSEEKSRKKKKKKKK